MPEELHKIRFSADEIAEAATAYYAKLGYAIPDVAIVGVDLAADPKRMVTLRFGPTPDGNELHPVELSQKIMFDALLSYCRSNDIPVARNARKRAIVEHEALVVVVDHGWTGEI
ncbi:MAG: hypothetical protein OQJ99_07350 [Rhodospirillales bacterium]|nr:hypothetical protein [Rhodospirillales bacterium]MCW8861843.1 hypothetical protein [Rhodospirillales bacterium]MCW9003579.1 hypothetical protein [Rhodospirillales bacterium]MCW9039664.1 hypothetical protein [Rhodospirillales bacterium]